MSPPLVGRVHEQSGHLVWPEGSAGPGQPGNFGSRPDVGHGSASRRTAERARHTRARGPEAPHAREPQTSTTTAVVRRERDQTQMAGQKIRIRLKSYDHEVIDSSARK